MIRHLALLLLLSFSLLFVMPYLQWLVVKLYQFELFFTYQIGLVFSNGMIGRIIRQVLALTLTPVILAGIPAIIYWIYSRRTLPHLAFIIWGLWFMLVLVLACHQ